MKILHCCLANFYIDNYGYQENIFAKIHKQQGNEVKIIASTETYLENKKIGYIKASSYYTRDNVPITRLAYWNFIPFSIVKKLRLYRGLKQELNLFEPDIIFVHGCQFLSLSTVVSYVKKNKCKLYVDCHSDFINSAKNWISKNILHKLIYRLSIKGAINYVDKFYGTLPLRCEFLHKVYKVPKDKIHLLPFGVDDSDLNFKLFPKIKKDIRKELNIEDDEILLITGGKIDRRKNIHELLHAFVRIKEIEPDLPLKLLIFGTPVPEMKEELKFYKKNPNIRFVNWLSSSEVKKYLIASDLALFPGTHSVLWEESIGLGLPCIFKKWDGMEHLDLGGNCVFLNEGNSKEITQVLTRIIKNKASFTELKKNSELKGPKKFIYSEISRKAIS